MRGLENLEILNNNYINLENACYSKSADSF
jgi:hypothetical protein